MKRRSQISSLNNVTHQSIAIVPLGVVSYTLLWDHSHKECWMKLERQWVRFRCTVYIQSMFDRC